MVNNIEIAKIPDWVVVSRTPTCDSEDPYLEQFVHGYYTLLIDQQKNLTKPRTESFYRRIYQINSAKGLNHLNSVQIDFYDTREKLYLHHINILRDQEVIAALDESQISVFRREQDLENNIITGIQTCHHLVPGLSVGDQLDIAYSRSWDADSFTSLGPEDQYKFKTEPVLHEHYRLLWPNDAQIVHRCSDDLPIQSFQHKDAKEIVITDSKPVVKEYEEYTPAGDHVLGVPFSIGAFDDWGPIADWGQRVYVPQKPEGKLQKYIQTLKEQGRPPEALVAEVLDFCSNEIAYTAIRGENTWNAPNDVHRTFERKYGDCKDKVHLFVSILSALGIEAYAALVNTDELEGIQRPAPSLHAFNHVIAYLCIEGQDYWLDVTQPLQGKSLKNGIPLSFGKALLLKKGETTLRDCLAAPLASPTIEIQETFDFQSDETGLYTIKTKYLKDHAVAIRNFFHNHTRKDIAKRYLSFLQKYYPDATQVKEPDFQDQYADNIITVEESYQLNNIVTIETKEKFVDVYFTEIYRFLFLIEGDKDEEEIERQYPFSLAFPEFVRCQQTLLFPKKLKSPLSKVSIQNDNFKFAKTETRIKQGTSFLYEYKSLKNKVIPNEWKQYISDSKKALTQTWDRFQLPNNRISGWRWFLYTWGAVICFKLLAQLLQQAGLM